MTEGLIIGVIAQLCYVTIGRVGLQFRFDNYAANCNCGPVQMLH